MTFLFMVIDGPQNLPVLESRSMLSKETWQTKVAGIKQRLKYILQIKEIGHLQTTNPMRLQKDSQVKQIHHPPSLTPTLKNKN